MSKACQGELCQIVNIILIIIVRVRRVSEEKTRKSCSIMKSRHVVLILGSARKPHLLFVVTEGCPVQMNYTVKSSS